MRPAAFLVAACVLLLAGVSVVPPTSAQQPGREVWPRDWFSDLPAVDMTGTWVFDAAASDPMLDSWEGRGVTYVISQQAAFIVLEFQVREMEANKHRYSWNGVIQRFERGGRQVEEAARWTEAGRMLEIVGRDWDPAVPEERREYRFTYVMNGDQLTFVQESETGRTVWRFSRQRLPGDAGN